MAEEASQLQDAPESTTVVVIGAGPAGMTVATLLQHSGIDCVVLERRSREHVARRQRAGIVETRAVRMFDSWGLTDKVLGGIPYDGILEFRVDGRSHLVSDSDGSDGPAARLCPQQVLVQKLTETFLEGGGDLRFEASDVSLHDLTGDRPTIRYRAPDGTPHALTCDFVAGCDGDHGVSRTAVPDGVLTAHAFDHGIGWLTVLADAPPPAHPLLAVSAQGFAAHFPRGPHASRYYLQCPPDDTPDAWPDQRVWDALRTRLGDPDLVPGPITDREVFRLRSLVHDPMSYGRLFLVGDAAHIVSPMGGKGMNLALYDADLLVRAVRDVVRDGDDTALSSYSARCLRRVWNDQEFSHWLTRTLHDAGDADPFPRHLARARLDRLFHSPAAARAFAELMTGLDLTGGAAPFQELSGNLSVSGGD
ncbi:4-hydroxybenzoate 3-monooxygenase [Streptomyces griseorubiginosus]|uniref:4-hydroxybenzoate 3-monooxygenase n=1 Tax=Streptomyces griseorubiginosus TaxID=67304 RepID=UPI002E816970|nr:4-hydroxybenzoate 3-monooxygenase [Streptomyces griseorubiginosus]WUB42149.1 4-hydroxybenzoate 3-monooxygenase [Streptomyces griseorubiginosus]WUB50668.1 4-hydroxybenzoate 3-monooxygenase [Streptomyces griseorubiginosus]